MRQRHHISRFLCLLLFVASSLSLRAAVHHPHLQVQDSVTTIRSFQPEVGGRRKMVTSQHPIQMQVTGGSICIRSNNAQMLPIYDGKKDFYMAMHLNKGINWLNGLPRGKYYINNRQVTIN